ncbi:MAG: FAD-dependent oxidoreductase [Flavobacteriales bacterium]|jgi:NADPH-dependent 2,4-dienoyl-CoA reductase/sulfur reductase-like enzyme/rhodanese-related sulfurtransferase|nr:FAD-dependent oxidoreductase [Flavobacteriales bacterium]
MKRIIVIGGLSAGPSAAAKARRENEEAEIILFEKGANISYATCGMPYALSGVIENREKLIVVKPDLMRERFNINVKLNEEIIKVDSKNKVVYSSKGDYEYDSLIFATGARSIVPPIKGIQESDNWSTCRTMGDFDKISKEALPEEAQHITVIGAGLIGVEVAENLIEAGKKVTLIEGANEILPMWENKFGYFAKSALEEKGIEVITNTLVNTFETTNNKIKSIKISDTKHIKTDYVIMSIGIKPNTELLINEGAQHIANGALIVNERMETSLKDIYAAGDNVSIKNLQTNEHDYFPLGTHSNKGGRTAGANASGLNLSFKGAYKTAIIKVFDYTLARTGMNSSALTKAEIPFKTVLTITGSTPSYYPGQTDLITEIYYHADTNEILGAELFGEIGVDKRIDVLSTAIFAKLKVHDLAQLDLAYAPPFSPAKDPLVVSGFVSENISSDNCNQISVATFDDYISNNKSDSYTLLDVRNEHEFLDGHLPEALNISLPKLRENLDILDKTKPIILYCQKGLRGYIARLILKHNGFNQVSSLAGGYKLWKMLNKPVVIPESIHTPN